MESPSSDFSGYGFVRTFVLPALLVFVVPAIALAFFLHAQSQYDAEAREGMLNAIEQDESLSAEERAELTAFYETVPFSKLMRHRDFAENFDARTWWDFATFRWMIWLSMGSLIAGLAIFALGGLCVALSLRSQRAQYLSLSAGWHVLRIYGALQTVVIGVLVVALSFWVTALWFEVYVPKLIFLAGLITLVAVCAVVASIFKKPDSTFAIEGEVIDEQQAPALWSTLRSLCSKVGTDPPDQVIAGIDDNFFVTEQPVTVGERVYDGRTLYVSLSLLKQLDGEEADAVMAHEMAHFSGQDTTYSKKITPLLMRYEHYLQSLRDNVVSLPVFYLMLCFRGLYELSLGKLSRQREFRADSVAAETTSPRAVVAALMRIAAYSKYRGTVEEDLFKQERALETADIANRIESGFPAYASAFTRNEDLSKLETAHPFDSHPPMVDRFAALGGEFGPQSADQHLQGPGDGRWFHQIDGAEQLERSQWDQYEDRFRTFHEEVLAYRTMPQSEAELALVEKFFPPVSFEGKKGTLAMDWQQLEYAEWADPLLWSDVSGVSLNDNVLHFQATAGKKSRTIKMGRFEKQTQAEVLEKLNGFYVRHQSAVAYQNEKAAEAENTAPAV